MRMTMKKALEIAERRWRERRLSTRTIQVYGTNLRRLEREVGNLLDPDTTALVRRLKAWRNDQQDLLDKDPPALTPSKVHNDLVAMRALYDALIEAGLGEENPAKQVHGAIVPELPPRPISWLDADKICEQPDVATFVGLRDRTILECMRHGMRQNEFVRLLVGGVQCDGQRVFLRFPAKGRANQAREREIPLAEGASRLFAWFMFARFNEDVPEPDHLLPQLAKALPQWKAAAKQSVFLGDEGRPIYQVWVNRMYAKHRKAAGVDAAWTPHTFRHRFCTHLLESDVDPRDSMRLSGHSSLKSLMRYTGVTRARASRNIDLLPAAPIRETV